MANSVPSMRKVSRRLFLGSAGGAAVVVPFFSSLAKRHALAQETAVAPKRLIAMFTHAGCLTDRWFPAKAHGSLTAADYNGLSIQALAPYANKLLVPRGIRAMNEWSLDASRGQSNDRHTQVVGSYFTCAPVTPNSDDPFSLDAQSKYNAMPLGASLDHVCAAQVSPNGVPLFLRVSGESVTPMWNISYSAAQTPFEGIGRLRDALSQLTGLSAPGESEDAYKVRRGQSLFDLVRDDLKTLEGVGMSASDRQKLEAWQDLLDPTVKVIVNGGCDSNAFEALGLTESNVAAGDLAQSDISAKLSGSELDLADLFSSVAVLAALCHLNPVIFLKYPGPTTFQGLGLSVDSFGLANRTANAMIGGKCYPGVNDLIEQVDRFYATKFARLVGLLDGVAEGEGTVLDNTATVWFQEMSDGCAANLNNLPLMQAGSCGGYFRTGQAVNVDDGDPNLSRGNSSAVCATEGDFGTAEMSAAGTDPRFGNAPINKYFCNLMNAIGVRAGYGGFPEIGGTEPVTHYGRYDKTEDFIGGGTVPPTIHDPGEFSELRAT